MNNTQNVDGFDWYLQEEGYEVVALFEDGTTEVITSHADKFKTAMGLIYDWASRNGMSDDEVNAVLDKQRADNLDLPPGHGYELEVAGEDW